MEPPIYIPGLTARKQKDERAEAEEAELAEIRRKIASEHVDADAQRQRDRAKALKEVRDMCKEGLGPITITDEMKELGLEAQVKEIIAQYDLAQPYLKLFRDDEEDDSWSD